MTLKLVTRTLEDVLTLHVPTEQPQRERWAVALYDLGAVSRAEAAKIAGLPLSAFFDVLARENATHFAATGVCKTDPTYTAEDLRAEVEAASL